MANNCRTTLTVNGPEEEVAAFVGQARQGNQEFTIQNFLPVPKELPKRATDPETTGKSGHPDQFNWRMDNWGTSGDATGISLEPQAPEQAVYHYTTPYSPFGEEAMTALSKRFPKLRLHAEFHEPMMSLEGHLTAQDGAITSRNVEVYDFYDRYQPVEPDPAVAA